MLFSCCFKPVDQDSSENNKPLKANLLDKEKKIQNQNVQVQVSQEKSSYSHTQHVKMEENSPVVVNNNLEKMQAIESYLTVHKHQQDLSYEPENLNMNLAKTLSNVSSNQQAQKSKCRSDMWLEADNKILYFAQRKGEEMVMAYKIIHRKIQSYLFEYVLKPHRLSNKFKNKPSDFSLCLVFFTQSVSKLKNLTTNLFPDHNVRPIFGVFKKQTSQKSTKSHYETVSYIHDIVIVGNNSLRLQPFQRIILALNSQKDFASVLDYCQKITQKLQLQDLSKITFIFPPFLTLSEINRILTKINRKFLIYQKLQKVINYISFQVELFQNFQEAIIVNSYESLRKQQSQVNKSFQIKLELAIGLLMIELDDNNSQVFQTLISDFLINKSIREYLDLRQFLLKDRKNSMNQLNDLTIFDSLQLGKISKSHMIQEKTINPFQKTVTIKYRHKKKIEQLFHEYHTTKTPTQQAYSKKQWDDDLKENDIRVTILDKPNKQLESNCNIFEVIDDSYVQKANLEAVFDDDQIQFNEYD